MIQFTNQAEVKAGLLARVRELEGRLDKAAAQARQIGVQEVQANLYPGHGFLTGNLSKSYERCSTVASSGPGVREITWTSDVDYQPPIELVRAPHLIPGIHAAIPQIKQVFEDAMK